MHTNGIFLKTEQKKPKKHLPTEYDVQEFPLLIQLDKDQGFFLSVVRM